MSLNVRFYAARKAAHLSQAVLARAVGVSQGDISRIEQKGWIPPQEVRDALADALTVPVEELFNLEPKIAW